ncbi:membrane protein insertion efficiency factor YidD [Mageeibacillus indolicus]|uniref:Putative membrane protein insertion efficiency factor n=2 Tax=Mageeibacillus indolicus TaxID=884684 RepID=D3R305_MAGIU|nr:membrane protein insertion efficiency factor YidD [Mageeibacillus indolicus]ADC90862.1 conserved hypothetical protein YidD [Mageeibacillus indolicus UPII9-5]KFA56803.1 membrane protein [Mageeibacillus indolicus 0009-5]PNH18130.1 membrane protein insertion efficiency factor YidD [Mageeibacillus indolicus]
MRRILLYLIKCYQVGISPYRPACCKYLPTCSEYAQLAIKKYGALLGGTMALWRLLRCNPFSKGGYDPVK